MQYFAVRRQGPATLYSPMERLAVSRPFVSIWLLPLIESENLLIEFLQLRGCSHQLASEFRF